MTFFLMFSWSACLLNTPSVLSVDGFRIRIDRADRVLCTPFHAKMSITFVQVLSSVWPVNIDVHLGFGLVLVWLAWAISGLSADID